MRPHFKPFFSSLRPLVARSRSGGISQAASHSALLFLILIDLDLFLCLAAMKKREVPRDWKKKILSASPRSNSHTPKLGPLYKIYCLKLSRNKKFTRPGCFNALRWIIKKYAFPDNGEGNFNTFGCKFIEETRWHIFVRGLYMTLSCSLISLCKEMVKYSSSVSHWIGLNVKHREWAGSFFKKQRPVQMGHVLIWVPR